MDEEDLTPLLRAGWNEEDLTPFLMGRFGGWAFVAVVSVTLAAGITIHEWNYRQDHPGREGVSGVLIVLSLAVVGVSVAAGLLAREFVQMREELRIVRDEVNRQYQRLEEIEAETPRP